MAKTQQRTIQRLIEIMASHCKATGTDEPR
jgi:hypothetical protein